MYKPIILVLLLFKLFHCGEIIERDGYIYYFSYPLKLNWHTAFRHCTYNGMYMLDIHTEEENVRVTNLVKEMKRNLSINEYLSVWLAGTDNGSEGQFYWETTGFGVQYNAWGPGEPNNYENRQNCMVLFQGFDFKWADLECEPVRPFFCRNKLILPDTMKNKVNMCSANGLQEE